jgi:hypothetical protein
MIENVAFIAVCFMHPPNAHLARHTITLQTHPAPHWHTITGKLEKPFNAANLNKGKELKF